MNLYALRFEPLFRDYIWGGTKLRDLLGKSVDSPTCAESWEIVDHTESQSKVLFGPLEGQTLSELIQLFGPALLGTEIWARITHPDVPRQLWGRFPLLFKFLDARQDLSLQVHPDDKLAATQTIPDWGKTEAWFVVSADPDAKIYAGLKPAVTREQFSQAASSGTHRLANMLHVVPAKQGQCLLIPAGTIHAIGAGVVIAEIQQASDTTFRIFDWNRVGPDGRHRPLQLAEAMQAADFHRGPIEPVELTPGGRNIRHHCLACSYFSLSHFDIDQEIKIGGDGRFRILAVLNGNLTVSSDPSGQVLTAGQTILLPASLPESRLTPNGTAEFLEIFVP